MIKSMLDIDPRRGILSLINISLPLIEDKVNHG